MDDPHTVVATTVLVDPRGWLLLQERDEHAPISPDCWGLVGGHVEPDEGVTAAAYREVTEETGLVLAGGLRLWRRETRPSETGRGAVDFHVYTAPTTVTDADVVCGEGRQIVFVDPRRLRTLRVGDAAEHFLRLLLSGSWYAGLVVQARLTVPPVGPSDHDTA